MDISNFFCSNCHSLLHGNYCTNCGHYNGDGLCPGCDYCLECGNLLEEDGLCPECAYNVENIFQTNEENKISFEIKYDGNNYFAIQKSDDTYYHLTLKNEYVWLTRPIKLLQHICFFPQITGNFIPSERHQIYLFNHTIKIHDIDVQNLQNWGLISNNSQYIIPTPLGNEVLYNSINTNYCYKIENIPVELLPFPYIGNPVNEKYVIGTYYKINVRRYKQQYQINLSESIINLKEHQIIEYAEHIGGLVSWFINSQMKEIKSETIVPVPCYRKDLCHTYEIALYISENTGMKLQCPLIKVRDSSQDGLSRSERIQNVHDSYDILHNINLKGKTVLLLDDIITTGSTLDFCKKLLYDCGAAKVKCLAIAKTIQN